MINRKKGFTLIELLITIAIVGILAAIAVPGYGEFVRQSRRSAVKQVMTRAVNYLENCYTLNHTYAGCLNVDTNGAGALNDLIQAEDLGNFYEDGGSTVDVNNFTLVARAKGSQLKDSQCVLLSISRTGQKTSSNNAEAVVTTLTSDAHHCW